MKLAMKHTCPVKRTEHNIGQQQKKHRSTLPNFPDITRTFKERLVGGHTIMSSDESAIALKVSKASSRSCFQFP